MPLGIDPLVDYVFKKLFADPANSDLLIHLLNSVLKFANPIVEVTVLNPFNEKDFEDDKRTMLDIKATCSDGRIYNIEVQRRRHPSLCSRVAFYAAELYADQLHDGDEYDKLMPAISIWFLGETVFDETATPHLRFTLSDRAHHIELTDRLQVHTIELPKYNFVREILKSADELTRWSFFLREAESLDVEELRQLLPDPPFTKAAGVVEMIAKSPEERLRYEARLKAERNWKSELGEAREQALEQGREQGLEQGVSFGQVQVLQKILQEDVSSLGELKALSNQAFTTLFQDLKRRSGIKID